MIRRKIAVTAAVVFAAAFVVRLAHVLSCHAREFPPYVRPMLDAAFYDEWARAIAGGEWVGTRGFEGVPLYGYFLALVYAVFGEGPLAPAVIQSAIGSLGIVFLYLFTRAAFSEPVALVAAGIGVVYEPFLLYESLRVADGLAAFFASAVLLASFALVVRPTAWRALGVGALIGLATLARERFLLFAPILLAILALRHYRMACRAARPLLVAALLVAGVAAPLSLSLAHNLAAAGDPVLLSSSGGVNFFIGNRRGASGSFDPPRELGLGRGELYSRARAIAEESEGRALAASEVSSYWTGRGLAEWRATSFSDLAGLFGRKFTYFFKGREMPDVVDYDSSAAGSFVLSLPLLNFRVVGPLALAGLALAFFLRRRDPAGLFCLYGLLAAHLGFLLLFFVTGRFRVSAVPILLPFAGAAVVFVIETLREKRFLSAAIGVVAIAFAAVVVNKDPAGTAHAARLNAATTQGNLGQEHYLAKRYPEAEAALREAIRIRPDYAKAKYFLALVYRETNRNEEAFATVQDSIRDDPGYGRARTLLGQLLIDLKKRPDLAIEQLDAALKLDPRESAAAFAMGAAYQILGNKERSIASYRLAAAMDPRRAPECEKRIQALGGE